MSPSPAAQFVYDAWAVASPGFEPLVAAELRALGFADATESTGGVSFHTDGAGIARANLHSRIASRIVVRLASFRATAFHELERAARKVEWARMLAPDAAFQLRVTAKKSRLYHSDAIAERVADAIARSVKGATRGAVPVKDEEDAEGELAPAAEAQLFVVRFDHDRCTISADASGALLHRRGYRLAVARAPLRETVAAAMLAAARYDANQPVVDPFCGSGTLLIEAAQSARRMAPGLARGFAAERWPELRTEVWRAARDAARTEILPRAAAPIIGSDRDEGAVQAALANAARAGVSDDVRFVQRALSDLTLPAGPGLVITNPPYGVRVGERAPLRDLYARFGQVMRAQAAGWRVAMLSADRALDGHTGLGFRDLVRTSNGGIPVRIIECAV